MTANATVSLTIRLKDAVSAPARGVKNAFKQIGDDFAKLRSGFDLAGKVSFAATAVNQLGAQARGALTSILGPAMQFEEAIARAGALTSNITDKEMADLTAATREMGRETRYTATEAAEGLGQLAIAGFNAREQIGSLPAVLKLTQASGVDMGRTADILSDLVGAFGKEAKDSGDVAGLLAATFSTSTTTLETLYETMKVAASVSTKFGVSMEDTAIATGLLGNSGLKGTQASTALVNAFSSLNSASKKGSKALRAVGLSAKDVADGIAHPLELLNKLDKAFEKKGFSKSRRMQELSKIFGKRGTNIAGVSILMEAMGKGGKDGASAFDRLSDAVGGGQTKLNQIAKVMDSTGLASVRQLNSAVESLKIDLAEQLGPTIRDLIEDTKAAVAVIADWARKNPELVSSIGKILIAVAGFAAVFGPLLLVISSLVSSFTLLRGALILVKGPFTVVSNINKELALNMSKNKGAAKALGGALRGLNGAIGVVGAAFAGWKVGKMLDSLIGKALKLRDGLLSTEMGLSMGEQSWFNDYIGQIGETYGIDTLKDIAEGNRKRNEAGPTVSYRGIQQRGLSKEDLQAIADRPVNVGGKITIEVDDKRAQVKKVAKLKNGPDLAAGANF